MPRKSVFLLLALWLSISPFLEAIFPFAPSAEELRPGAGKIISSLQEKYESIESLQASFEQENELKTLGRTTKSSGSLLLNKPGKLRVEYVKPESLILVSDGRTLWLYTARFKQVMVSKPGRSGFGNTPLLFLAGKGNLKKNFDVFVEEVGIAERSGGVWKAGHPHRIRLEPKTSGASFRRMWLEVEPGNFKILALAYIDNVGNRSRLRFSNVREDVKITGEPFRFVAPPGAEIVQMPTQGALR